MLEILELHGTTSRIYQVRDLNQATWPSWLYQVEDDRGVVSEMGSCVSRFKLMFFCFCIQVICMKGRGQGFKEKSRILTSLQSIFWV